jgi:hypothetical protein
MPDFSELSCREIQQQYRNGEIELQSEAVKDCAESIKADNPGMDKETAFAICQSMENEGELSDNQLAELEDPCWEGYVPVGTKEVNGQTVPNCVPEEDAPDDAGLAAEDNGCPPGQVSINGDCVDVNEVDAPPSILQSDTNHFALKSLESEPISRTQNGNLVTYESVKLLAPGVWSDAGSQSAAYYHPEGIKNLTASYDESEHDGPPVNIMHDVDMQSGETHEPSIAGHVDPDSLNVDDEGNLFGDIVLDTSKAAGEFADENLQSALESQGTMGFGGPSVEIPADGLKEEWDDDRGMPAVMGGKLSGLGLVMNPASKSVSFAQEVARRGVAMSDSQSVKAYTLQSEDMSPQLADAEEMRETLETFGFDTGDMSDEDVMDMAEDLHEQLMEEMQGDEDGEDTEMGDYEDDDDEDDEDDDMEMEDDDVRQRMNNMMERIEELEDMVAQAMTQDDVEAELEEHTAELAAADDVESVEKKMSKMLEGVTEDEANAILTNLKNTEKESKTLAEPSTNVDESKEWREWANAEGTPTPDTSL